MAAAGRAPVAAGVGAEARRGAAREPTPSGVAWRCWPLLLGNVVEWYEFSVYGYLAPEMKANFFSGSSVATWLVFAVTFVSRPLGGLVLGWISDQYGRKVSVNMSIAGMLVATAGQGFLPSTRSSGQAWGDVGCVLLIVLRFGQGISAGGEVSAIIAYMGEVAPKRFLGSIMMLVPMTGCVAFLLANAVVALVSGVLGDEGMLDWGWRLPFLFALLPGSIAVWGRRHVPESEVFLEELQQRSSVVGRTQSPKTTPPLAEPMSPKISASLNTGVSGAAQGLDSLAEVFRSHGLALLISIGAVTGGAAFAYVGGVWSLSYLKASGLSSMQVLWIGLASKVLDLVLLPLFGMLIDSHGAALILLFGGLAMVMSGFPTFAVIVLCPGVLSATLGVGVAYTVAKAAATPMLFCAELFPTSVRTLCLGISWNVSVCLFGGLGSVLSQLLLQLSPFGPGLLMSAAGCITMSSVLLGNSLQRGGRLRLEHLRAAPRLVTPPATAPSPSLGEADGAPPRRGAAEQSELAAACEGEAEKNEVREAVAASAPLGRGHGRKKHGYGRVAVGGAASPGAAASASVSPPRLPVLLGFCGTVGDGEGIADAV